MQYSPIFMQTRQRRRRTDSKLATVTTRSAIQASASEVRKDLQRLTCEDWTREKHRKAEELESVEAVLGLASLVAEAETQKRHKGAQVYKPQEVATRKRPSEPQATPQSLHAAKPPPPAAFPTAQFLPFPPQFPLPMLYPHMLSVLQYQYYKLMQCGLFPPAAVNSQQVYVKPQAVDVGVKRAGRHVAIARMIQSARRLR